MIERYSIDEALEFANAMAALNCKALGAQGGIASGSAARRLIANGERRSNADFAARIARI